MAEVSPVRDSDQGKKDLVIHDYPSPNDAPASVLDDGNLDPVYDCARYTVSSSTDSS